MLLATAQRYSIKKLPDTIELLILINTPPFLARAVSYRWEGGLAMGSILTSNMTTKHSMVLYLILRCELETAENDFLENNYVNDW